MTVQVIHRYLSIPDAFRNEKEEDRIGITSSLMLQLAEIIDDLYWEIGRLQAEIDSLESRTHG